MEHDARNITSRQFGKYSVTSVAGAGGMGVVYAARDTVLGRTVALKFLPPALEDSVSGQERFLREAVTASSLDHPNIGTVFGIEEFDGRRAIVLAYYSGGSLYDRLRAGPLRTAQALAIAADIAAGLAAAHAHDIVHRDIKPSNILFGANGITKIVDFGLAKDFTAQDITAPGATMGTVGYMPPEQAAGKSVGIPADIWALGVVLYEMLLARRPFQGSSYAAVVHAVIHDKPDVSGLPEDIARIVERALRKKPSERFGSAREMLTAIEAALGSHGPYTTAATVTQAPAAQTSRKRRFTWPAAACFLLVALGGLLWWRGGNMWQPRARQVVVLSLKPGGDPSLEPVANGLTALVIDALRSAARDNRRLRVASSSEVEGARTTDVAGARRILGADVVLTLTLVREGDNLRATINQIDAKEAKVEAARAVTGPALDLAGLETRLSAEAARMLGLKSRPRAAPLERLQAASPAAYRTYVQADGMLQGVQDLQNPSAAIPLLEQVNGAAPGNAAVQSTLCRAYRLQYFQTNEAKWLDAADAPCLHAPDADPSFVPALIERGRFRVQRGDVQSGIHDLERAQAFDPTSETAARVLAAAYDTAGLHERAEATVRKAAEANPNSWNAYQELGEIYFRSGRFLDAARAFERATQLAPENNVAWTRLGSSLSLAEKLPEAEKAFLRSLQLVPTYYTYSNLGNLYLREERFAEAGGAYEKALEKSPRQHRIWANLAAAYSRMPGKQDQSRDAYRRAAELCRVAMKATPNDAITISNLASYEAFTGERAEPLALIQKALSLAPNDADVLYNGVEVYEYLGFREQALLWIGRLLEQGSPAKDFERSVVLSELRKDGRYLALVAASRAHHSAAR